MPCRRLCEFTPFRADSFISFGFVRIHSFHSDTFGFQGVSLNEMNETARPR
jgi:hypothetical protein